MVLTVVLEGLCHAATMCCAIAAGVLVEVLQPEKVCATDGERLRAIGRVDDSSGKGRRVGEGGLVVVALAVPGQEGSE